MHEEWDRDECQRLDLKLLAFLVEKAKTLCFVNDARRAYDVLKEIKAMIPSETIVLDDPDEPPGLRLVPPPEGTTDKKEAP